VKFGVEISLSLLVHEPEKEEKTVTIYTIYLRLKYYIIQIVTDNSNYVNGK
jgi:hypothetical protein